MNLKGKASTALLCTFALAVAFGALGCGTTGKKAPGEGVSPAYLEALERWTRSERVTVDLESRLVWSATYRSLRYRVAYVDEYSKVFLVDGDLKKSMLADEARGARQYNEFLVTAYTPLETWNDFDEDDSVWKLYLEDDAGRRVSPTEVERLDARDVVLGAFFPKIDYWTVAYRVRFPGYDERGEAIGGDASGMRLIVTGILGRSELVWK